MGNHSYPDTISTTLTEICNTGTASSTHNITCTDLVDLSVLVPTYLTAIPADPQATSTTGYKVMKNTYGKIGLSATAELDQTITMGSVTNPWTCGDTLIDIRDSQEYATVLIGSQCWMQENINVGTMILGAKLGASGINQGTSTVNIQKYCYDYNEANCTTYGGLYQWDQAMGGSTTPGAQGICPTGWHIPTHNEFTTLEQFTCNSLGNSNCATTFPYDTTTVALLGTNEGTEIKSSTGLWKGLLSDYCSALIASGGSCINYWSSIGVDTKAWNRNLSSNFAGIIRSNIFNKLNGYSVRCLKD